MIPMNYCKCTSIISIPWDESILITGLKKIINAKRTFFELDPKCQVHPFHSIYLHELVPSLHDRSAKCHSLPLWFYSQSNQFSWYPLTFWHPRSWIHSWCEGSDGKSISHIAEENDFYSRRSCFYAFQKVRRGLDFSSSVSKWRRERERMRWALINICIEIPYSWQLMDRIFLKFPPPISPLYLYFCHVHVLREKRITLKEFRFLF